MVGSLHEQHSRQVVEEDCSHPSVHLVRSRSAEVPVDDDDRDDDGENVDDEGEEEVPGDEWDGDGGWRKNLGDEKQEDDQREKNGDTHRHLLASIRRKEEDADAEEGDEDTGNDEVDGVEECPPPDDEEELDVGTVMSLILAVFLPGVALHARNVNDVPRSAVLVIAEIHLFTSVVPVQVDLVLIKGPRPELHDAFLFVEREILDVNRTRTLVDGGRDPE